MQGKPRIGERLLEDALEALARALNESGAPWMVIGGIAIIARGVRRSTADIDASVRGDAIRPEDLVEVLQRHGIAPRIPDALAFAKTNLVLLLRHERTGVDLDVSFAWSGFEHDALAARTSTLFGSVRVPMCSPNDLVVFKAIAGRPQDLEDARALLALYPDIDAAQVRRRVVELAALAEAPELVTALDSIVVPTYKTTPRARKKKGPRRRKTRRSRKRG